jgi:hypothetical protein
VQLVRHPVPISTISSRSSRTPRSSRHITLAGAPQINIDIFTISDLAASSISSSSFVISPNFQGVDKGHNEPPAGPPIVVGSLSGACRYPFQSRLASVKTPFLQRYFIFRSCPFRSITDCSHTTHDRIHAYVGLGHCPLPHILWCFWINILLEPLEPPVHVTIHITRKSTHSLGRLPAHASNAASGISH